MDIMHLIAAAAQQQATLASTPGGPSSYYSYFEGTENDDWQDGCFTTTGDGDGSVKFAPSKITIAWAIEKDGSVDIAAETADKIDLDGYDNIEFYIYNTSILGTATIYLTLTSNLEDGYADADYSESYQPSSQGNVTTDFDVSAISSSYYIGVHVVSSDGFGSIDILTVQLEV